MFQRLPTQATWDDLVLPAAVTALLREIAVHVRHHRRVLDDWNLSAEASRRAGVCTLFSGPPGTGKTLAAEVLAHELELNLYRIDLSAVVSKYIGETEKNLARLFDAAEESGAILFFDEADALFGKRTDIRDSHDRYADVEISYLLQRMEEHNGLAILATNMRAALDPAFLRRLHCVVDFPLPDAAQRCRLWQRAFPPGTDCRALDFGRLATLDLSGGNIRNIALRASLEAAAAASPVTMAQVLEATDAERYTLGQRRSPAAE
jgi:SpoVK/Ycf46/Vps4 family AAA+-type ATPase